MKYFDKNEPIEVAFSALITELNTVGTEVPRTLIYGQTRKQFSVLFRTFEVFFCTNIINGSKSPKNRIVEMYHAGTPKTIKDHIVKNMTTENGHLRVLISTIAFGLGIDCKKVRRVIHFGPSKSIEMYVQECGRAGRDGLPSTCVFLYNGLLSSHCENDMKQYIQVEGCRRKWLMGHFGCNAEQTSGALALHAFCDMCAIKCSCGGDQCTTSWGPQGGTQDQPKMSLNKPSSERKRLTSSVTKQDKKKLQRKLIELHQDLARQELTDTVVTCQNVLLEFNAFHINQIVDVVFF